MEPWLVFRCATGREKSACERLERQGIHALAPRTRTFEKVSRKRIIAVDEALFKGYLFAQVPNCKWTKLQNVPAVNPQPLMMDGEPYRLCSADMDYLQSLALNPPKDRRDPRRIQVGDNVSIAQGPFQGFHGSVAAIIGKHVQVLVHLLGRLTAVHIAPDGLEMATSRS